MRNKLPFLILTVVLLNCATDKTISQLTDAEQDILNQYKTLEKISQLTITDNNEPGDNLYLCLTFIDKETKVPLSNQNVLFYHTNSEGNYEPEIATDETSARLKGKAKTTKQGRIFIETILPGNYGSGGDNRHVHTTVIGAKPEAYDIHFKQFTGYMGANFVESSDQHFLAELKRSKSGYLVSFLTIEVKNPQ
ncbi:MAG: hypothetical protein KJO96_03750 [Winogradskyella sp.]|nr:hypothetical protein [Winogradskyella sp.]